MKYRLKQQHTINKFGMPKMAWALEKRVWGSWMLEAKAEVYRDRLKAEAELKWFRGLEEKRLSIRNAALRAWWRGLWRWHY